ncbi:MFS transporter [Amycolatopsis jejuensis]|uniref:MFS transporter n=1 Tax=Amycolatopsis jejuensis TaxID=330084 RepID=UPI000525F1AA|nr:MFS transporter [Amycolatopsis jejuensis]
MADPQSARTRKHTRLGVVAASSLAGTAVEWYDFFLYGTASTLVFNKLYFPAHDPMVGTVLAFATYAVGFLARPAGAVVLGHLGDRKGRRSTLIASLLLMGASTFLIALLPTYAAVGVLAPALLVVCRLVQGFALGGEWGGAVLLVSEHGDSRRRAFWSSWPNVGPPLGNLLAAGVLAVLGAVLPSAEFLSWGWRIAFGLSAVLVLIGLWLRLYVAETPLFKEAPKPAGLPAGVVLRKHWRSVLLAAATRFGENAGFYLFSLFVITYVTTVLGMPSSVGLTAVLAGQACAVVTIPLFALLADRVGRRPVYLVASAATIVWAFVFFALVDTRSPGLITVAVAGGLLIFAAYSSVIGAFFAELFPTEIRYSGVSLAYNLASVLAGSLAPIIAIGLYAKFGTGYAIAVYLAVMGAISLVASLIAKETKSVDLGAVAGSAAGKAEIRATTAE